MINASNAAGGRRIELSTRWSKTGLPWQLEEQHEK